MVQSFNAIAARDKQTDERTKLQRWRATKSNNAEARERASWPSCRASDWSTTLSSIITCDDDDESTFNRRRCSVRRT